MGKTSLLKRLAEGLKGQGWCCCFVDLATLKNMECPNWFRRLGEMIARAVRMGMILSPFENQQDFRTFLLDEVGLGRSFNPIKVALFFDEVEGLLGLDFSDEFLMTLRDMYQQRDSYPGQLLIAFAGSVDPETLIKDSTISPFNIAEEIVLDDFTAEESLTLTSNLTKIREGISIDEAVHSHIYEWAAGQPYLTQRICEIIADLVQTEKITCVSTDTVDDVVRTGLLGPRRLDKNVKHVLGEVAGLKSLAAELWKRLLAGEPVYSTETGFCALYLTGAVAEAPDGRVGIRNRIYEQALVGSRVPSNSEPAVPSLPQDRFRYDAFISYSHEDSAWVRDTLLPRLEGKGLRVCIDFHDFEPGAPSLTEIERAVLQSRKTLLALTPDYLASEWAEFENILVSTLDPAARQRRVIPLLLKPCELPLRTRALTYLDFTGSESELQFQRLVAAIRSEPKSTQPLPASPPVSSKASDLRLIITDPFSGTQLASHLEFSIPRACDPSSKSAWQIAFRLCLDNEGATMARYVDVEMYITSDTDSFWTYSYDSKPFDIAESPRAWQIELSNTHIHCRFLGGADFVCHSKARQNLGMVKMLVPYGQADTTVTFSYRMLAEGHESQGSFVIALKSEP